MKEAQNAESMEEETHNDIVFTDKSDICQVFTDKSDICQQLLHRYAKSSAPQHRHLCATAAATRSIIQSESMPLTPLSYFAATIDAASDSSNTLDANAVSALSSFLSIVLPLVPEKSIAPEKAADAVAVLVELVDHPDVAVSAPSVRAVVKCIGVLVGFCDLKDWESVKLGFQTLAKFSIDKRPKVRKCAQDCVMNVLRAFESSTAIKKASKLVLSFFKSYMKVAVNISASSSCSKDDILSKPDHLEVLHMLNLLKHLFPYLSADVSLKALLELQKLITARFSALTRHIFDVIKAMFESLGADDLIPEADGLTKSLASYISVRGNPQDTVLSAAYLLKNSINNIHVKESSIWTSHLSLVIDSLAGLLTSEANTAAQASNFLIELISCHIGVRNKLTTEDLLVENEAACEMESTVTSTCAVFSNLLSSCGGVPNEHILAVISALFLKLGEISYLHMKDIICKLADFVTSTSDTEHLQECFGSATIAMGPEKLLDLLPISLNAEDLTCSNTWLIPILKNYVTGASLGFFIEHVVPLAVSFVRASHKVKKSVIRQDLKAHARGLWGLLPAFCHHPMNMHKNIKPLAKLLIPLLKEDSFMVQNIAIALQELVNQNKVVVSFGKDVGEFAKLPKMDEVKVSATNIVKKPSYSIETADRNLRALASCSEKLLQALTDVLFELPHEKRTYLKGAIGCLASISDSSVMEKIFISSLERFQLVDDSGDCGKLANHSDGLVNKEECISNSAGKDAKRCVILELACSIVEGASENLVYQIFDLIKQAFQEADEIGQCEAYITLNKILEKHSWFCSSKFIEVMDLLVGLKSPVDVISLRSRFACFQTLLIHTIKTLDEDKKTFLILNEIILTLKDSDEVVRKAAYDIILAVGSSLRNSSSTSSDGPYHKLINMIMGYLSGSSPHIKSGAVSALSVFVHNDADICLLIPDLVPSVLELLQSKAIEVIKAVLGFVKVLVLTIQVKDLQNFLSEIVISVLPWSSISRHHFRSKVTVILEIMMRKCGAAAVKLLAPEKYRNYVKSVLENHRGKTTSKETGSADIEPKLSESSPKGWQKRKRKQYGKSPKEEDSAEPRKRKREGKWKGISHRTNGPRINAGSGNGEEWAKENRRSGGENRKEGPHSEIRTKNKRRNLNTDPSSGKREMKRTNISREGEARVHRPAGLSDLPKNAKRWVGNGRRKGK